MKRMMIATALATTVATAGFALTESQIEKVDGFNSGIDTSTFTERDYNIAYGIVTSGMSHGEKTAKLRALESEDNVDMGVVMLSDAEKARLQQYAPDVDFVSVTQAQAEAALAVTYGGETPSTITERVQNILGGGEMDDATLAVVSAGQENMLRTYVPEADLTVLTEDELQLALSYAYSGMSRSEKTQQIEALLN